MPGTTSLPFPCEPSTDTSGAAIWVSSATTMARGWDCRRHLKGEFTPSPMEFKEGGWQVLIAHEMPILEAVQASGRYRLVVYGHTHLPEVKRVDETLVVNPGECGGWLYGHCTAAIAHLETLEAETVDL